MRRGDGMIDTDKYEGHSEGEWIIQVLEDGLTWNIQTKSGEQLADMVIDKHHSNAELMRDAPLLLAEVKRLRKIEQEHGRVIIDDWEHKPDGEVVDYPLPYVTLYHGGCEYVGRLRLYKNEDGEVIE